MTTSPVSSSLISEIGYDPIKKVLAVKFKSDGATYHYANVGRGEHEALIKAKSLGSHFITHIKKQAAKHPFTRQLDHKASK